MAGEQQWRVSHSDEVAKWISQLNNQDKTRASKAITQLQERGPDLREPHSKPLGDGLHELRFRAENVNRRVTYHRNGNEFRTLTTFRKQRQNERREVERAKLKMKEDRARLNEQGRERGAAGRGPTQGRPEVTRESRASRERERPSGRRQRGGKARSGGGKRDRGRTR